MHDLPRQLSAEELAELFEGRTRFIERLAREPDPLVRARTLVHELSAEDKRAVLDAHPAIGATKLSARSAAEQGSDDDPEVLAELARVALRAIELSNLEARVEAIEAMLRRRKEAQKGQR